MKRILAVLSLFVAAAAASAAGSWTNDGGPYGGRIQAVELFGTNQVVVGTRNGGVFVSRDAGATWEAANAGLADLIVNCVVVNPLNPNTAFIGTSADGVYRTRDLGSRVAWTNLSSNLGNPYVQCLAICRGDTSALFAGTINGVFKSTTGGRYWFDMTNNLSVKNVTAMAFGGWGPDTVYAAASGVGGGVFKSTNGGDTWTLKNNGFTSSFVTTVRVDPASPNVLLAGTSGEGMFKSTDGGDTWARKIDGLGDLYVWDLRIQPDNPQVYYAGTSGGFFVSMDSGESWSGFNDGLKDTDVHAIAADDAGDVLFAGGYWGGIHKSVSGGSWQQSVQGMTNTFVSSIDCHPYLDRVTQVSSYGQVFVSADGGATWEDHSTGIASEDLRAIAIDQSAPDTVYCGAYYGGVYKSIDGGVTWTAMRNGLTAPDVTCLRVIHVNSSPYVYAGTYNYLFRSTDGARIWEQKSNGLPSTASHIWTIEIDPTDSRTVYAGTYGGGLFKTTNSGDSWTPINNGLSSIYIAAVAVDPGDPDIVYAGAYYGGGVFKSWDGGAIWSPSSNGMDNVSVWSLDVDPLDPDHLLAGTPVGAFLSVDGGHTWQAFSDGLDVLDTRCVMFHRTIGGLAFAGTYGGGVYSCEVPAGPEVTEQFHLSQNYPNPFNSTTTVKYSIAEQGHVTLKIYNAAGQLVRTLVDEEQSPRAEGFAAAWDGTSNAGRPVASSVYFYQLRARDFLQTKKMVFLK
jgi:photosystem II stability/assembly factor-like uncharacterized protein